MSETIKQAVSRAKGKVFVLLDPHYAAGATAERLQVSKPEARRLIDAAPKSSQPVAVWQDDDLLLQPNCFHSVLDT